MYRYTGISATARQLDLKHLNRDIRNRVKLLQDSPETKETRIQKAYQDMLRAWPNRVFRDYRFKLKDPSAKLPPPLVPPSASQAAVTGKSLLAMPTTSKLLVPSVAPSGTQVAIRGKPTVLEFSVNPTARIFCFTLFQNLH